MTQKTGFAYHSDYLNHDTGPNHPERPRSATRKFSCTTGKRYLGTITPHRTDTRKYRTALLRTRTDLP